MNSSQKKQFFSTLTGVCELYGKKASPELMLLYWATLECYELDDVKRAFQAHAVNPDNGQFMPKPADVVRFLDGGSQTRAAKAWAKVHYAMRCIGGGESVVFDDAIIHASLEGLGSWPELCATNCDELTFLQGRFEKRYQAMAFSPPAMWPRLLIGRYQSENEAAGKDVAKPIPVGNVEQCRVTYKGGVDPAEAIGLAPLAAAVIDQIKALTSVRANA